MKLPTLIVSLLVFPAALFAQGSASETTAQPPSTPPNPDVNRQLQAKQAQLATVSKEIDQIQIRAEGSETVQKSKAQYEDTLKTEMVRTAPEMEKAIVRRSQLLTELSNVAAPETTTPSGEQTQKLREFLELRQQLLPIEQKAQSAEPVQTARSTYYTTLVSEMKRIDPKTEELLKLHRDLTSALREIQSNDQQS